MVTEIRLYFCFPHVGENREVPYQSLLPKHPTAVYATLKMKVMCFKRTLKIECPLCSKHLLTHIHIHNLSLEMLCRCSCRKAV